MRRARRPGWPVRWLVGGALALALLASSRSPATAAPSSEYIVSTLVPTVVGIPSDVAVDTAGNVYVADAFSNSIKEWVKSRDTMVTLVPAGREPTYELGDALAVDRGGNVYFCSGVEDFSYHATRWALAEWVRSSNTVRGLFGPFTGGCQGVAVDGSGNVYIVDSGSAAIKKAAPPG